MNLTKSFSTHKSLVWLWKNMLDPLLTIILGGGFLILIAYLLLKTAYWVLGKLAQTIVFLGGLLIRTMDWAAHSLVTDIYIRFPPSEGPVGAVMIVMILAILLVIFLFLCAIPSR